MHGFPKGLDLSPLVGRTLDLIGFGPFTIHLSFDGGHQITVENRLGYRAALDDDLTWDVVPVTESRLMRLSGQTVATWTRGDESHLEITFAEGGVLQFLDDSPSYEAVSFSIEGKLTFV